MKRYPQKETVTEKTVETNQHFLFGRVAYREEFVVTFKEECCMYSCDDMNKIKTDSVTAVSR